MVNTIAYLACPYSHEHPIITTARVDFAGKVAAKLFNRGVNVFSPVNYLHQIALENSLPTDWKFWENFCRAFLSRSEKLYVLKLYGWEESTGVLEEIRYAQTEFKIPIEFIDPDTF